MSATVAARAEAARQTIIRFTTTQRLEHIVLMLSFTVLALTGLPQKFNDYRVAELMIRALGGIENVRIIHRFSAIVLMIESAYHVITITYTLLTGRARLSMLPTFRDVADAWHMVLYYLGVRKERPLFDRYDFRQKFEYWAVVWGTVIVGVTGLMMWFPITTTQFLPGEFIPAAKAAHGGEALLAVLAIIIWHMYSAHLNADIFPFDKTIFTGYISQERMLHEHPLEYARLVEGRSAPAAPQPHLPEPAPAGVLQKAPPAEPEAPAEPPDAAALAEAAVEEAAPEALPATGAVAEETDEGAADEKAPPPAALDGDEAEPPAPPSNEENA